MKKLLILSVLILALSSCMDNDMDDKMQENGKNVMEENMNMDADMMNDDKEVELTNEDQKIVEEVLGQ